MLRHSIYFIVIPSLLLGCAKKLTDAELKAAAKQQAQTMVKATLAKDFATATDFMFQEGIDSFGGRTRTIQMMQKDDKESTGRGFTVQSVAVGDPEQLTLSGKDYFAIVSESLEMTAPGGNLHAESFLLGRSQDDGRTWKFLDGAGIIEAGEKIKTLLPALPSTLKFPAKKDPVFTPSS